MDRQRAPPLPADRHTGHVEEAHRPPECRPWASGWGAAEKNTQPGRLRLPGWVVLSAGLGALVIPSTVTRSGGGLLAPTVFRIGRASVGRRRRACEGQSAVSEPEPSENDPLACVLPLEIGDLHAGFLIDF
jgi:hypothetical protein